MLFFRSEELLNQWLASQGVKEHGAVLSIPKLWELSQHWYQDRISSDYRGRKPEEVEMIFKEAGLTSEYWQVK